MNAVRFGLIVFLLATYLQIGAAEGNGTTICAHHNVVTPTNGATQQFASSSVAKSTSYNTMGGEIMADNRTIRCHSYCFTLWTSDVNRSKVNIVKQGCWIGEANVCIHGTCVSHMMPKNHSHFCCCSGDMCNENVTDAYDPAQHTTTLSNPIGPLQDYNYRIKTIIISLVSVFSVALVIIVSYFSYRMCLRTKRPAVKPSHPVEAPLLQTDFDMNDLSLYQMISKGRYAEVWKGKLGEQDVAIKIYSSHYREYYNNERSLYCLPFMEHDCLVKFFGTDERITQEGTAQLMIVTGFIPLGSLCGYLKNNVLEWAIMVRMAHSIARGLSHLHTDIHKNDKFKPVLAHRDLNTRNVLVRADLNCVITDLGFCVATMGSKLIKKGHAENAEQTSLTDVGTLRYMAPELLDGAVNLRDCEASLKQIDIYALGLCLWEIASRCIDLYQGAPMPEYTPPYQTEVGSNPTFEEMQMIVVRSKRRPKFPEVWKERNQAVRSLKETIEECWDADAEARLTALCVEERISDLPSLWAQEYKHRGITPTLNAMINIDETLGSGDRSNGVIVTGSQHDTSAINNPFVSSSSLPLQTEFSASDLHSTVAPVHGENTSGSLVSAGQVHHSWLQEQSVSASTVDTILPITPLDSSAQSQQIPPKSSNLLVEKNNAAFSPHQGRNPMVERNTHKSSDEELRVRGNTLVLSDCCDSLSTQSAPADHQSAESPPDSVGDGLETSLVMSDALNQHRNPPIPYLQNHVHGEIPAGRPKVANTAVSRNYSRGERSFRDKLIKFIKPRELGLKLITFSFFNGGRRFDYSRADDMEVDDFRHEQTASRESQGHLPACTEENRVTSSGDQSVNPIQTEVHLQNGTAVTRPSNLPLDSSSHLNIMHQSTGQEKQAQSDHNVQNDRQSSETNLPHNVSGSHVKYPENRLRFAEVGIAKLRMPTKVPLPVLRREGANHSKSTSELLRLRHNSDSCWQETELSATAMAISESDVAVKRRPNSLSLVGHAYSKPSSSSKTVAKSDLVVIPVKDMEKYEKAGDINANTSHCPPAHSVINARVKPHLDDNNLDSSEKIRRRVKTPILLSKKSERLSLYDDRLMSCELDSMISTYQSDNNLKKSLTSSKISSKGNSSTERVDNHENGFEVVPSGQKSRMILSTTHVLNLV